MARLCAPGLLCEAHLAAAARPIKHAQALPVLECLCEHGPRHAQLGHAVLNVLEWNQSARSGGGGPEDVKHHVERIAACHLGVVCWRWRRRRGDRAAGAGA